MVVTVMMNKAKLDIGIINFEKTETTWDEYRPDDFGGRCHFELENFSPTYHKSIMSEGQES